MFKAKFYENPIKHTDAIKIPLVDGQMHTPPIITSCATIYYILVPIGCTNGVSEKTSILATLFCHTRFFFTFPVVLNISSPSGLRNSKIYYVTDWTTIITIHVLPNISKSKGDLALKFGHAIGYKERNIFL